MASKSDYSEKFLPADWKDRFLDALLLVLPGVICYAGICLVWEKYRVVLLFVLALTVILKAWWIAKISSNILRDIGKVGMKLIAFFGVLALIVLFVVIDSESSFLWANQLGISTSAQVKDLFIRGKHRDSVVAYEYSVDGKTYTVRQEVTDPVYQSLEIGDPIGIKYIPAMPRIASVNDDGGQSKIFVFISIYIAWLALLYVLEDKIRTFQQKIQDQFIQVFRH